MTAQEKVRDARRHIAWPAVLVLIVSIVIAGALLRVDLGDPNTVPTTVKIGETGTLNNGERLVVNSVKLASRISIDGRGRRTTSQIFLVVNYTLAIDRPGDMRFFHVTANTKSGPQTPFDTAKVGPSPGFKMTFDDAFEMGPEDLAGTTVTFITGSVLRAYDKAVVVDLELDEATVKDLVEAGRYTTVDMTSGKEEVQ